MEGHPQVVKYRGESYFVCDYTGALIRQRFFVPDGIDQNGKVGSYCTLPVLLRACYEKGIDEVELADLKEDLEKFYDQPFIPMQQALATFPIGSQSDLVSYLSGIDKGQSWMLVNGAEHVDEYRPERAQKSKARSVTALKPVTIGKKSSGVRAYKLPAGLYIASANKKPQFLPVSDPMRAVRVIATLFASGSDPQIRRSGQSGVFFIGSTGEGIANPFMSAWGLPSFRGDALVVTTKQSQLPALEKGQKSNPEAKQLDPEELLNGGVCGAE
jgi:hypothetical protein